MKIVLTGGPSAGKTSVVEVLARSANPKLAVVEEAAALLFRGGFPRHAGAAQIHAQQIAIYHVQKQLEAIASADSPANPLICDRGSLDGLAYWIGDQESYFASVGSTMDREIARYDWVIHLDTAGQDAYSKSAIRIEDRVEAERLNERVKQAWSLHPRRVIIKADHDFLMKIQRAVGVVDVILTGQNEITI